MRRAQAPLLAGLAAAGLAVLSGAAPPGNKPDPNAGSSAMSSYLYSPESIKFFYEDVYEPLFKKTTDRDGRVVYASGSGSSTACKFPAVKAPGTFRIFVVGESVGLRFYEDSASLAAAWGRLLPGRRIEFLSASVSSYDGPRILMRLREAMGHQPDLLIVLTGNNENPDPASEPSMIKRFAVKYALRSEMIRQFQGFLAEQGARRPMRTPEEMLEIYRKNLTEMAQIAARGKVPVVFCALPRNLAGAPPANILPLWDESFFRAWSALERGDDAAADKHFAAFQREKPDEPLGHYSRALSLRRLKRLPEAADEFRAAVERSLKGVRPSMNVVLREVAARYKAAVADFEKGCESVAPDGIADSSMFDDEVHWHRSLNPFLNALVERAFYEGRGLWPYKDLRELRWDAEALGQDERAGKALLASRDLKDEARRALLNGIWLWSTDPQRIDEKSVAAFDAVYRLAPGELARLFSTHAGEEITKTLSTNWWTKDKTERLAIIWPQVLDCLGEMYRRRGLPGEAAKAFRLSLQLAPDRHLTRLRLALAENAAGERKAARRDFALAQAGAGDYPEINLYGHEYFPTTPR